MKEAQLMYNIYYFDAYIFSNIILYVDNQLEASKILTGCQILVHQNISVYSLQTNKEWLLLVSKIEGRGERGRDTGL